MFPPIRLLATSKASGSANVLLRMLTLPPTCSRRVPSQHDCNPLMVRFPPTVVSSKSLYTGVLASEASSDHGAGAVATLGGVGGVVLQLAPPPPPRRATLPLMDAE